MPISQVDKVPPTILHPLIDRHLKQRLPLRTTRFSDKLHAGLLGRPVALVRVALDAAANNVLPDRRAALVARDDVIKIQLRAIANAAAILAGVMIALENVVSGELHLFFGRPTVNEQQNHLWNADFEGNASHRFFFGKRIGDSAPALEVVGLKFLAARKDDVSMAEKQKCERPFGGADVDRLPQTVEHQDVLSQCRGDTHWLREIRF